MKILPAEFEIPLYKYSCSDWSSKKEKFKLLIENQKNKFTRQDDSLMSLNTTFYSSNLKNEISDVISEEIKWFENDTTLNLNLKEGWFQVYNYTEEHPIHNHGIGFSCVVFINFIKSIHNPTCFVAPFVNARGEYKIFCPQVEEGDILFFPSTLPHYSPFNKSKVSRIIASLNFEVLKN